MSARVLVLISSSSEWRVTRGFYPTLEPGKTPYGECFEHKPIGFNLIFCQGGVGKISAAASTEYAIQRWQPDVVVNLGTCGGFAGLIETGEIVLAQKTIIYDILEQMGDSLAAIARYATVIDLTWLPQPYPLAVRSVTLVSADRDLRSEDIPDLHNQYGAVAADWESGAIAWVASRHHLPTLILRGVTDLVGGSGGQAYGDIDLYHANTRTILPRLLESLPAWLLSFISAI